MHSVVFWMMQVSIVAKQSRWPLANEPASKLFEKHILSPEMQGYINQWRVDGWAHPIWHPRGVDNLGHRFYDQ